MHILEGKDVVPGLMEMLLALTSSGSCSAKAAALKMSLFGEGNAAVVQEMSLNLADLKSLEATEGFASAIILFGVFIYKCWAAE